MTASSSSYYERHLRNPKAKQFYDSAAWKRCRKNVLAKTPWCSQCGKLAQHVHHVQPISTPEGWERRLDPAGLLALCQPCHNAIEAEAQKPQATAVTGMIDPAEDEKYFFDPEAAARPIRFIERLCKHYEGRHAGKPFLLHPVQAKIISDLYGWKERSTSLRRFSQAWLEAAAGAGKSPLLAAIGLYELVAGGEEGNQIYCVGSNYAQGRVIFDCAKRMIDQEPALAARLYVTQYEISYAPTRSFWRIISGTGQKAGLRPGLVLADEIHEWKSREVYDSLQGRMTKRTQPLWISATNAGENRQSLCWQLHEEAAAVLSGTRKNPKLYPIIWAASPDARPDDPAAWRQANPLIGTTVDEEKIRQEQQRSEGEPALEARFRRLYLGHWTQTVSAWLDISRWDSVTAPIEPEAIKDAALYVGLDMSLGDDLCAAALVYVTPQKYYVDARFWLPKQTAEHYEAKQGVPYSQWAKAGDITLLDAPTISPEVRKQIADELMVLHKAHKIEAVCYDRAYEQETTATLSAAGIRCEPIPQGWSVSPGAMELDRRLKDGSIVITQNKVLRANAEVVEVKFDQRGNYWPVKPMSKGKYAGTRSKKIDGISALVSALTVARLHNFPKKTWAGKVWSL